MTTQTLPAHHTSKTLEARGGHEAAPLSGVSSGLLLTALITAAAFGVRELPEVSTFSPLILAIVIGMAFQNAIGTPAHAKAGVTFALRKILRFAIILLGLQLTAAQIIEVGATGIAVITLALVATFVFTTWLGGLLGVEKGLTQLIAAGTSICGASAVIATSTVTNARDEDVAYAVACVTVFGSIAMFVYPLLPGLLHLDPRAYGLWSGASIHEIAQVIAAAFQDGRQAGEFGTIAKLTRVVMLAPMVIALGLMASRRNRKAGTQAAGGRAPMPWFVLGFVALVGANSVLMIPPDVKAIIVSVTTILLAMALAAMGLEADIGRLRANGLRPLALGAAAFLFIASFSLILVKITTWEPL